MDSEEKMVEENTSNHEINATTDIRNKSNHVEVENNEEYKEENQEEVNSNEGSQLGLQEDSVLTKDPSKSSQEGSGSTSGTLTKMHNYLETLSDTELLDTVKGMQTDLHHFKLENLVFQHFLEKNDAAALEDMDKILDTIWKAKTQMSDRMKKTESLYSKSISGTRSSTVTGKVSTRSSLLAFIQDKGPRINLTQKTDLVLREMEETQNAFQSFVKRSHRQKSNLKAELEEISIRKSEIQTAREIFEESIVIEGVDPLTQRIPAEKFVRYMEEWLKSAQAVLEKIRLRVSTYKIQFNKVSNQLLQKQELGETLHAVDFEQLEIENKRFYEKIEDKNNQLLELKRMNGLANLVLSNHKQYLQKQTEEMKDLKQTITDKERKVDELDIESQSADREMTEAKEKYENMKTLMESYSVPETIGYINKKAELYELKKNLKIWSRRKHIQDIALRSCIREMKNLTGAAPTSSWFRAPVNSDDELLR